MKPKHILFGMLALFAASCANDEMNEVAALKQNGIQVTAGLDANTRVGFEQDGDVTHAFWEEGDQITLYAPSQGALNYQVSTLGEGGYSATFSAIDDVLKNTDETIYAAYAPDMAPDIVDGTAILPNTETWIGEHPLPFAYAISKVSDGKVNLSFQHIFAYLKLTLNAETVAGSDVKEITDVYLTNPSGTPISIAAGRFDFSTQSIIEEKGIDFINYRLQESFTATGTAEKSIYIPILPQPAGENIKLSVLHVTSSGCDTLFTESKEVPSTGFVAGRAYTYSPKSSITRVGNTVTLTEAGTLSQAISAAEKDTITSLKIIGPLNGDDIRFIREMAGVDVNGNETTGKLTYLDISEATIVEGGEYYYCDLEEDVYYYTSTNVIGDYMFCDTNLERIILPNNIAAIGDSAFNRCFSLTSINIPDAVTSIGNSAFYYCPSLSEVTIGNGVTSIGEDAFVDCLSLSEVYISDLSAWCKIDFGNRASAPLYYAGKLYLNNVEVTELIIPDDITEIKQCAFLGCSSLTSINIPDAVTSIGHAAFDSCYSLSEVTIGNGITSIGNYAFNFCSSLTLFNIPDGVTSIGYCAFCDCSSLSKVTCNATTPPALGSFAFSNIAESAILYVSAGTYDAYMTSDWAQYFTTIDGGSYANGVVTLTTAGDLPYLITDSNKYTISSLKVIGPINGTDIRFIREMAGLDVDGWSTTSGQLVDLDMSEAMIVEGGDYYLDHFTAEMAMGPLYTSSNEIGEYMFGWSDGYSTILEKVLLPNTITCIGGGAFEWCRHLTSINIPDSVKTIRWLAFNGCSNIETITIPSSVVNIENQVFFGCSILSEVTCLATTPPTLDDGVFDGISSTATLIVPAGSATAYSASDWAQYFTTIEEM